MNPGSTLDMHLNATVQESEEAVRRIAGWAVEQGMNDEAAGDLRLAAEELMVNICSYAYPEATGVIDVRCFREADMLCVELQDSGVAFDPASRDIDKAGKKPVEERAGGGMGIALARGVLDSFSYERVDGMNMMRIGKKLLRGGSGI